MKIYLASKSPRRHALLKQMAVEFELLLTDTLEIVQPNETAEQYSKRITTEKLQTAWGTIIANNLPLLPVLCADTEVVVDQQILGKPQNYQHAVDILKNYSGRSHQVITSVGIQYGNYQQIVCDISTVHFAPIPDAAIHTYLAMGDYLDKAGAYGIQSYIGQYISRIEGCFFSVMGLPLFKVRELLTQLENELKQGLQVKHD